MLTLDPTIDKIRSNNWHKEGRPYLLTIWDVAKQFEKIYVLICREITEKIAQWIIDKENDFSPIPTEEKEGLFGLNYIEELAK
ncbi:MAG: hypothetical protein ACLQU2_21655, partial [Candidatus Binataceae bacterium]